MRAMHAPCSTCTRGLSTPAGMDCCTYFLQTSCFPLDHIIRVARHSFSNIRFWDTAERCLVTSLISEKGGRLQHTEYDAALTAIANTLTGISKNPSAFWGFRVTRTGYVRPPPPSQTPPAKLGNVLIHYTNR